MSRNRNRNRANAGRATGNGGGGGGPTAETLLADLTTAAGTAPTALWIPGTDTFSDDQETPAGDGDRVYQINDQTGNGYHMREGAASKGPVLRSSGSNGIGTKPALQFLRTNSEYLQCILDANGATPNLFTTEKGSTAKLINCPDNGVADSTPNNNPAILAIDTSGGVWPSLYLHDSTTSRIIVEGTGRQRLTSTEFAYDTDHVLGQRIDADGVDEVAALYGDKSEGTSLTSVGTTLNGQALRIGKGAGAGGVHLSAHIGPTAVWNVTLTEAQMFDVVDTLRAYAGLSPVADP